MSCGDRGYSTIVAETRGERAADYLSKMGFSCEMVGGDSWDRAGSVRSGSADASDAGKHFLLKTLNCGHFGRGRQQGSDRLSPARPGARSTAPPLVQLSIAPWTNSANDVEGLGNNDSRSVELPVKPFRSYHRNIFSSASIA